MKKAVCLLFVCVLFLCGCAETGKSFTALQDFEGAKIASLSGAAFADLSNKVVPGLSHDLYNTLADEIAAVTSGKADAAALDEPVARFAAAQKSELVVFPEVVVTDKYGFAVKKGSDLGIKANAVLEKLKADGTIKGCEDYWFFASSKPKELPELTYKSDFDGSAGILKYSCDTSTEPMCYAGEGGKAIGLDVDIASRIAYELNMKFEVTETKFDSLLAALSSGKADMVGSCMSITEERLKSVDFVGPYYNGGIVFLIKKDRLGS